MAGGTGSIVPDTVSASLLVRVVRAAVDEGASRNDLLAAVGIDSVRLRNPLNRFSSQIALRFFAALERFFADPAIALRIGEYAGMQNFSDFGYSSRLAENLASVISIHTQIQQHRHIRPGKGMRGSPHQFPPAVPAGRIHLHALVRQPGAGFPEFCAVEPPGLPGKTGQSFTYKILPS